MHILGAGIVTKTPLVAKYICAQEAIPIIAWHACMYVHVLQTRVVVALVLLEHQ